MSIRILGTGSALPSRAVTNEEIAELVETSDEWIRERTGIAGRHVSTGETVASLAAGACDMALRNARKSADEVELLLVATCSPEDVAPCAACQVQKEIGAGNAVAFDLNAACAGFLFALHTAWAYVESGIYRNALVAGSEVLSKLVDWKDRGTCILFGDGAGAAIVRASESDEEGGILSMVQGSDGAAGMVLNCSNRPVNNPYVKNDTALSYTYMNGQEVYKFAVRTVPRAITQVVEQAGLSVEEIDYFLLHQANYRIIEAAAKRLKQPMEKFPTNLQECGNISAASVPILLDNVNRAGTIKKGDKVVMAGFGAGLTWGAAALVW